jgi:hypothetical protein
MPGLRTKHRGHGRLSHRLIQVEIYVLATVIAVAPVCLVVLAVHLGSELLFAFGGEPGEPARTGLAEFRETFLPLLYAVLAFAAFAALVFARRIVNPLAKLVSVSSMRAKPCRASTRSSSPAPTSR